MRRFEYVKRELGWFERYCKGLPDTDSMNGLIRRFLDSVDQRYDTVSSKEMMLRSDQTSSAEEDLQPASRGDYGSHIPPRP